MSKELLPYCTINLAQDPNIDGLVPLNADDTVMSLKDFVDIQQGIMQFYADTTPEDIEEWERAQQGKKPEPAACPGYIYLIGSSVGQHKIDKSKYLHNHHRLVGTHLPFATTLLHTMPVSNMDAAERFLHQKFEHCHLNGEWFALQPEEVAWITSITDLDTVAEEAA